MVKHEQCLGKGQESISFGQRSQLAGCFLKAIASAERRKHVCRGTRSEPPS